MEEKLIDFLTKADNECCIFILRNNHFVYTNKNFDDRFGYNRNEIINLTPSDIFESKEVVNFFNKLFLIEDCFQPRLSTKGIRKDKTTVEVELKVCFKTNINNSVIIFGTVDINKENDKLTNIDEDLDIIFIKNINGEVIYSSKLFDKLYSTNISIFADWYETADLVIKMGIVKYKRDFKFPDGTYKSYKIIKIPLIDKENNNLILSICNIIEDSQLQEIEDGAFIELDDINITIDSKTAITVLDSDFKYTYANENFCNSINLRKEDLIGSTFNEANSGYHGLGYFENIYKLLKTGKVWRGNVSSIDKNGRMRNANVTIVPMANSSGNLYKYVTIRNEFPSDVYREQSIKETIQSVLEDQIHTINNNMLLTLFILKIEEYNILKMIHGEILLERIKEQIYKKIKVNYSGKIELISITEDTIGFVINDFYDYEQIDLIAKNLSGFSSLGDSVEFKEVFASFKVGVSMYSSTGESAKNLINNAYFALELAKINNEKYKIYSTELVEKKSKEYILKKDLFNALEDNQLVLYYQPRFNNEKIIIGAEALIRWKHPKLGMISPAEFIYIAEQTELIIPIGEWVILKACEHGKEIINKINKPIIISVNVSPTQLLQADFVNKIMSIINETKYDIKLLEIEITEDSIKSNNKILKEIELLRELGFSIAIDDFGTGYSSFELLKGTFFDTLKIDRIFTLNIYDDKKSKNIISSLINLALDLNLNVLAEGVENEEQFEILKSLNCIEYQGYLLSKPVPLRLFESYLESQKSITQENRKYFRYNFKYPLEASFEISEINNIQIKSGKTFVEINNISEGGLSFCTNISFLAINNYVLDFKVRLLSEDFFLQGVIVWSKKEKDLHKYGLQFSHLTNDNLHNILEGLRYEELMIAN